MVSDPPDDGSPAERRAIDRRRLLRAAGATGASVGAGALAGCGDFLSGERTFRSSWVSLESGGDPAEVAFRGDQELRTTRSVESDGGSVEATLVSHVAQYGRAREGFVDDATVALLSTPDAEVGGQRLNPAATRSLGDLLTSDVADEFLQRLDVDPRAWREGPDRIRETSADLLGTGTTVETFRGITEAGEVVLLNATRVVVDGDAVVVGAVHRRSVDQGREVTDSAVEGALELFLEVLPLVVLERAAAATATTDGTATTTTGGGDGRGEVRQVLEDEDLDALWKDTSQRLLAARREGAATDLNGELLEMAESVENGALAVLFEFWAGENLARDGRNEAAIERYDQALERYDGQTLVEGSSLDIAGAVLRKRGVAAAAAGRVDEALATYDALANHDDDDPGRALYRKGLVAERAGRDGVAERAYGRAAEAGTTVGYHVIGYPEIAARAARRVTNSFDEYREDPEELLDEVAAALDDGDFDRLRTLASPTHFTAGPAGGCHGFRDAGDTLEELAADAGRSDPTVDPSTVSVEGRSAFLETTDWSGERFSGRVDFLVSETPHGWEFSGVVLYEPTDAWRREWEPEERGENDPPSIHVAAPWDRGLKFRAGGLRNARGTGGGCGTGTPGYYYNHGPTHKASLNQGFAIDFTRYKAPFITNVPGSDVLATNWGLVADTVGHVPTHNRGQANHVHIDHLVFDGFLQFSFPYQSRYLHLDGPNEIGPSEGQLVFTGNWLGNMDDTGYSALHHLHFSIRDADNGYQSVRPTPMDGHRLRGNDRGDCVTSNNDQISY